MLIQSLTALAQPVERELAGQVVHAGTGEPVVGANVILVGTLYGTVSDAGGHFSLAHVKAGHYTLRVSMTGLGDAERAVVIPDDLTPTLTITLEPARVALNEAPLEFSAEAFGALSPVAGRGDPYLANQMSERRIPGVSVRRFGAAYSYPIVRGLSEGRTETGSLLLPGQALELPGVGILDYGTIAPSGLPASILKNPIVFPGLSSGVVGFVQDRSLESEEMTDGNAALADIGFQTNTNMFGLQMAVLEGSSRVRTFATGRYNAGTDFTSGADTLWEGGFRHGGLFVMSEARLSARSHVVAATRIAHAGSADFPGSDVGLENAWHSSVSAAWTAVPEAATIRRATATAGWARSNANLAGIPLQSSPSEGWSSMEAESSVFRGSAVVDLNVSPLDRLQSGVVATTADYRWTGALRPGALETEMVRMFDRRVQVSTFVVGTIQRRRLELALAGMVDVTRTRVDREQIELSPYVSWSVDPGLSFALIARPRRGWEITLTGSTRPYQPPLSIVSPVSVPPTSRTPPLPVQGDWTLGTERVYFTGLRLVRSTDHTTVAISPFAMLIDGFLSPRTTDATTFEFVGTDARVLGFEASAHQALLPFVSASGFITYHRGWNTVLHEPLPLIQPLTGRLDLTASAVRGRLLFEVSSEFAVAQNRVARSLEEETTDGYIVFHFWLALPLGRRIGLRTGVYNLFDALFAPHGHVFVEEHRARLAAPGRSWLISLRLRV